MPASNAPAVTDEVRIGAPAEAVYALITDLPTLAELAEETTSMQWTRGDAARAGAVFRGANRSGSHTWTTTCTVTTANPGVAFAWDVTSGPVKIAHWRYEVAESDGGCHVTESMWDYRPWWLKRIAYRLTGVADRDAANTEHIRLTLQRLKDRAEATAS
ncbi:MAG TPA: SRPBCC family protein [Mycobacterium sp.]|nr:SRPBCC family protein [Mycobacterium sp.]